VLNELLTPPLTKAFGFLNQKGPEEMRTERLELFQSNLELIEELALIEQLLAAESEGEGGRSRSLRANFAPASTQTEAAVEAAPRRMEWAPSRRVSAASKGQLGN
jgi:hypothetical protein